MEAYPVISLTFCRELMGAVAASVHKAVMILEHCDWLQWPRTGTSKCLGNRQFPYEPGDLGLWSDWQIEPLARIARF